MLTRLWFPKHFQIENAFQGIGQIDFPVELNARTLLETVKKEAICLSSIDEMLAKSVRQRKMKFEKKVRNE